MSSCNVWLLYRFQMVGSLSGYCVTPQYCFHQDRPQLGLQRVLVYISYSMSLTWAWVYCQGYRR